MNTTTSVRPGSHVLSFEVPTWRDYLNGGFGDLVAQCACGAFEYVYSRTEGAYWHSLHVERPTKHAHHLLMDSPMPEGWAPVAPVVRVASVPSAPRIRLYTCPTCKGLGSVEASYQIIDGRFHHWGERATCAECAGSGSTDRWLPDA